MKDGGINIEWSEHNNTLFHVEYSEKSVAQVGHRRSLSLVAKATSSEQVICFSPERCSGIGVV